MSIDSARPYDGWWYYAQDNSKSASVEASKKEETKSITTENGRTPSLTSGPNVKIAVTWHPFSATERDRLEDARDCSDLQDFPNELVVSDSLGQRLNKVNYQRMTLETLYWNGPALPVRRVIWLQMKSETADAQGGTPVTPEWDRILEAAYEEEKEWLDSTDAPSDSPKSGIVEKIVALKGSLASYVLILRKGIMETATLTHKSVLDASSASVSPFNSSSSIKLIRGYIPYYICVMGAMRTAGQVKEAPVLSSSSSLSGTSSLNLPNPFEELTIAPSAAPRHLILAVHGIGQKYAGKMGTNFANDCDLLRERCIAAATSKGWKAEDFYLIPVTWRDGLSLSAQYHEDGTDASFEDLVQHINIDSIPAVREIASDVGLDILLYMTPTYFTRIIKATLEQIRRVYSIFIKVHGEAGSRTKVSLLGHSLGSAILSDLLSFTTDDLSPSNIHRCSEEVVRNLGFTVDKFFTMGSPVPIFFLLKQLKPYSCIGASHDKVLLERHSGRSSYPSTAQVKSSEVEVLKPRHLIFACNELYNVFHPCDPIAYRMEPLVLNPVEMKRFSLPVKIPYHKKGALQMKRQVEESLINFQKQAVKAKDSFIESLSSVFAPFRTSSSVEPPASLSVATATSEDSMRGSVTTSIFNSRSRTPIISVNPQLARFNHHGRIDYCIEAPLLENAYISAITSHISYWEDIDIGHFLANEILGNAPSPASTSAVSNPSMDDSLKS